LQALDPLYTRTKEGFDVAIPLLEKAIAEDPGFALAYAKLATAYFFLDIYQEEKNYTALINNYADKALLYDSRNDESLIAKALYYKHVQEYRLALPHLDKALEYNPNSSAAVQLLAEHYAIYQPNTAKYLEYALRGIQIDIAASDSAAQSYIYLHLANALVQSGFVEEAVRYADRSLSYFPGNYYTPYARAFILYARDQDMAQTIGLLIKEWHKDSTRLDITQELGKLYFYERNYDSAFYYYKRYDDRRRLLGLKLYPHEEAKLGMVYAQAGRHEEAAAFYDDFRQYCQQDESIYKGASMAVLHTLDGNYDEAIAQLRVFAQQHHFQ